MIKSETSDGSPVPSKPSLKKDAGSASGKTRSGRRDSDDGWGGVGGYMDAKKQKLDEQFDVDRKSLKSRIFHGVAIYVNGYTTPSSDELKRMMQEHGGRYETYLYKTRVTHIIATNLPNSKLHMTKTMPVVKPEWITESVAAGRRLSHVPYLLYGHQSKLQPGLKSFQSVTSLSRTSTQSTVSGFDETKSFVPPNFTELLSREQSNMESKSHYASAGACTKQLLQNMKTESLLTSSSSSSFRANMRSRAPDSENAIDILCGVMEDMDKEEAITSDDNSSGVKFEGTKGSKVEDTASCERLKSDAVAASSDASDEDIVYNSEDDDERVLENGAHPTTLSHLFQSGSSPYKRRSRVYSFRKFRKSNSGSFDCPRPEDTNSCDGFIDCAKLQSLESDSPLKLGAGRQISQSHEQSLIKNITPTKMQTDLNLPSSKSSTVNVPYVTDSKSIAPLSNSSDKSVRISQAKPASESAVPSIPHCVSVSEEMLTSTTSTAPLTSPANVSSSTVATPQTSAQLSPQKPQSVQPQQQASPSKSPFQKTSSIMGKAGDKNFLNEFYSNSRLHHLSTWGAELKAYVAEIQRTGGGGNFPGREKLRQFHVENAMRLGLSETLDSSRHGTAQKTVMHIDMDCFFVSVGLLARPDLRGKPIAVTHSKGQGAKPNPGSNLAWEKAEWMKKRDKKLKVQSDTSFKGTTWMQEYNDPVEDSSSGHTEYDHLVPKGSTGKETFHSMSEIASCSYEARKAGVKNGMFMGRALQLCPNLQTIPYNFAEYNRISRILYDVVASYTHDIEAVSCDEMLIDCTDVLTDTGATAMEFAQVLRAEMMDKTGCPASTGIGPNILLARLATRRAKPNGQFEVLAAEAKDFIKDQSASDIPGVGYSMTRKLSKLGVQTCGDLQTIPVSTLRREFGPKTGESLHHYSLGQDDREVKGDKQRKSVSAEVNYGIRFTKEQEAITFLQELSNEVKRRLDAIGVKGRSITLKLMVRRPDAPVETAKFMGHGICNTVNKSSNLPVATNDGKLIAREVVSLYRSQRVEASELRGIGIQVNKLEEGEAARGQLTAGKKTLGHQSILNFAVAKSKEDNSSTTTEASGISSMIATTSPSSADHNFTKSTNSVKPTNSSTSSFVTISSSRRESGNIQQPVTHQSWKTDQPGVQGHHFTDSASRSSFPQQNISRGNSTTDDGRYDIPGPSTSHARVSPGPSTSHETERTNDVSLLSESQIDSDVLQELPSDIAQEIMEEIRRRKERKERNEQNLLPAGLSTASGSEGNNRSAKQEPVTDALPALSQLDLNCFNALPLHLQQELKAEYARQDVTSQRSADKRAALSGNNEFTCLRSPSKDKGKQTGAAFKTPRNPSRRGRPPGKKKLTFGVNRVKTGGGDLKGKKLSNTRKNLSETDVIICDDDDNNVDESDGGRNVPLNNEDSNDGDFMVPVMPHASTHTETVPSYDEIGDTVQDGEKMTERTSHEVDQREDPVLCGARWLDEVRVLLKEWLSSSPEPQPDDVTMVTEYFIQLVQHKNLEQAYCLLRFLVRKGRQEMSPNWQTCVADITSCVQNIVCANYGASFKL